MPEIIKLNSITDSKLLLEVINQIKSIFFQSSSQKEFADEASKILFFNKWCGDYIESLSDQFYVMIEGEKVLGYLSGSRDTNTSSLFLRVPALSLFKDLYMTYPAHFHINFHPDCRGRGLGAQLVEEYCGDLRMEKCPGVHIVTSPEAKNVSFYQKLNFDYQSIREFKQMKLLFLGRRPI